MAQNGDTNQYDYIVLGTGLVECIISSLLSKEGHRILHIDRNSYYGGACTSLSIGQVAHCVICFSRFMKNC